MVFGGLHDKARELRVNDWIDGDGKPMAKPVRLSDLGSGYKVILEAAPEDMYSTDTATSCAAMSKVVERYVGAYPSQYMWSMKRFKKRPEGEPKWY